MSNDRGPWSAPPHKRGRLQGRIILWLAFLALVTIAIWKLAELFPGQISSDFDQAELITLVALLVLFSSGVIYARQFKIAEFVRNLSIWTGIAAVLVLCFSSKAKFEIYLPDCGPN